MRPYKKIPLVLFRAVGWVMTHPTVLGEAVAIGILTDLRATYNEDFPGFTLTRFDGSTIVV